MVTVNSSETIKIEIVEKKLSETLFNSLPYSAQPEACRCAKDKTQEFQISKNYFKRNTPLYRKNYLGAFRGQAIYRIDLFLSRYIAEKNQIEIYEKLVAKTNASVFSFPKSNYKNYLIISPQKYVAGVSQFVNWRRSQGYNVEVETLLDPQVTKESVSSIIESYYQNKQVDFLILIGDKNEIPMHTMQTSGDSETPTDLPYLTFDGEGDYIPDIFASRITASSVQDLEIRLEKVIEFETQTWVNPSGNTHIIGISSSEGANPSDQEYIAGITQSFVDQLGFTSTHLNERDQNSNPDFLNEKLNEGARWLTYMGHGSGTSWISMNKTYDINHIKNTNNQNAVKPIIIDVACQNGRIEKNILGTTFLGNWNQAFGASAYYGGTVDISWHPPAIMATGIAVKHLEHNFQHLGEALLAGQLYLAENYPRSPTVVENMIWYHLQGDPGMNIKY